MSVGKNSTDKCSEASKHTFACVAGRRSLPGKEEGQVVVRDGILPELQPYFFLTIHSKKTKTFWGRSNRIKKKYASGSFVLQ